MSDAPSQEPEPPEGAPAYLVEPVQRQDARMLRELADYAIELARWREREIDPRDVIDEGDELVDMESDGADGTIVIKKVECGKESCTTCPHGPYEYRNYREGDKVRTEYIGPATESES